MLSPLTVSIRCTTFFSDAVRNIPMVGQPPQQLKDVEHLPGRRGEARKHHAADGAGKRTCTWLQRNAARHATIWTHHLVEGFSSVALATADSCKVSCENPAEEDSSRYQELFVRKIQPLYSLSAERNLFIPRTDWGVLRRGNDGGGWLVSLQYSVEWFFS
jgi:hypothetical protein